MTSISLAFEIIVIARFEILDQRISIQDKISKSTPGHAREKKPDPQIGSSVIARDKNEQRKVFLENVAIWAGEASKS